MFFDNGAWEMLFKNMAPYLAVVAILLVNALLVYLVSPASVLLFGLSAFGLCVALAFVVQWLAFIPAFLTGSEKFFDLIGSVTYVSVSLLALASLEQIDMRSLVIAVLVCTWAVRLGTFLSRRVHDTGKDGRFDKIKTDFGTFLMTWTLQGMWVSFCYAAGLAAMTSINKIEADIFLLVGTLAWLVGFVVQIIADRQKTVFRRDPQNQGSFISTGLWARSRHPNYFGEILIWCGITVIALPVLQGWQLITLISPVFTWLLLVKISGVRMLEARGAKRWGDDPSYVAYMESTPMLIPKVL